MMGLHYWVTLGKATLGAEDRTLYAAKLPHDDVGTIRYLAHRQGGHKKA